MWRLLEHYTLAECDGDRNTGGGPGPESMTNVKCIREVHSEQPGGPDSPFPDCPQH